MAPEGPRPPAEIPLLTPQQQAAFDAQRELAIQSGDPVLIQRWNDDVTKALNDAADARIAAAGQHEAAAVRAAEEAMRRAQRAGQEQLRQQAPGQEDVR